MNKTFTIFLALVLLTVGVIAYDQYQQRPNAGAGATIREVWDLTEGLNIGTTRQLVFSRLGAITSSAPLTVTGETRLFAPRSTGAVLNLASSSVATLTAAQVCDSAVITHGEWTGIASTTAIVNLPSAASLYADCLTANGDSFQFLYRNLAATSGSSTAVVAGASTTLVGVDANADIINGANEAIIRLVRYSATELVAYIVEATAAD